MWTRWEPAVSRFSFLLFSWAASLTRALHMQGKCPALTGSAHSSVLISDSEMQSMSLPLLFALRESVHTVLLPALGLSGPYICSVTGALQGGHVLALLFSLP